MGVFVRAVDNFVDEVNAASRRSETPLDGGFGSDRWGESVTIAKNMTMKADHSEVEIILDQAAPVLAEPDTGPELAVIVRLLAHEMSHPVFAQLRVVTGDRAADFPRMSARRTIRRLVLDALDEYRCDGVAEAVLGDLIKIDDEGTERGLTFDDMGDWYGDTWGIAASFG